MEVQSKTNHSTELETSGPLCLCAGGGHPRHPGPPSGGPQHHRDAGHHGSGSPAGGGPLHHGRVRAVRPQPAGAAGALQQHPAAVRQQGRQQARPELLPLPARCFLLHVRRCGGKNLIKELDVKTKKWEVCNLVF